MTTPSEPPYGQQPYGEQPQYGQQPPQYNPQYGGNTMGAPGPVAPLANYGLRAGAAAIDYIAPAIVVNIIARISPALGIILDLALLGWIIYNAYQAGETGQSLGKKLVGTRLINEATGQPIGGGLAIGRYFLHILDSLACLIGWLWPLWDGKKQTFADKLVHSVVVVA